MMLSPQLQQQLGRPTMQPRRCAVVGSSSSSRLPLSPPSPSRRSLLRRGSRIIAAGLPATDEASDKALEAQALQMGLADLARSALASDPEAAAQLKRYEAAVVRLEQAKAAEKELEAIMRDAAVAAAEEDAQAAGAARQRADALLAEAEVAAAERLLQAAQLEFDGAAAQRAALAAAAGADADRSESGKAGAAAAAGGLAAALPLALALPSGGGVSAALSLAATAAACLLFGVTYRYAVREDAANTQLRGGVVAAFGLVKALGAADILQSASAAANGGDALSVAVIGTGALYAGQCVLTFGFAAAALEAAFAQGFVKRMPGAGPGSS